MLEPNYIVGFVDGEGCFSITINNGKRIPEVRLIFEIELREDDRDVLCQIQETLGCGKIYQLDYSRYHWRGHVKYKVSNFKDISEKIIPFLQQYPLRAKKRHQFERFCHVAELIRQKRHLLPEGIKEIWQIQHGDSLDALDAHVQWGANEITVSQSPPVTS